MALPPDTVFVDGFSSDPEGPSRTGRSKLFHRKSRTGCQKCRARRVKVRAFPHERPAEALLADLDLQCDENRPACLGCQRNGYACVYDRDGPRPAHVDERMSPEVKDVGELTETRSRRLEELELMHFYITETGPSIVFDRKTSYDMFVKAMPRMALKSDALLYSIYAFAALHRAKTTGGDDPFIPPPSAAAEAYQQHVVYQRLAFQCHRWDLTHLSKTNAETVSLTANLIRLVACVVLSERSLSPYTPPMEWLRITASQSRVYRAAWELVADNTTSPTVRLIRATPVIWDMEEREGIRKRHALEYVLQFQPEDDPAAWTPEERHTYESTVGYIAAVWHMIQNHEPIGPIGRRLVLFPVLIERHFIDLVGELRPRALVVMAHYFALLTVVKNFWFIGNTGVREIEALATYLPSRWLGLIEWPLLVVKDGLPYRPPAPVAEETSGSKSVSNAEVVSSCASV